MMGLDVTVGEYGGEHYHSERMGSYSTYHEWRLKLAHAISLEIHTSSRYPFPLQCWPYTTGTRFELILNHSDSDGDYPVDVIPSLLKEVKKAKEMGINDNGIPDKFIKLCDKALEWQLPIEFY